MTCFLHFPDRYKALVIASKLLRIHCLASDLVSHDIDGPHRSIKAAMDDGPFFRSFFLKKTKHAVPDVAFQSFSASAARSRRVTSASR